MFLCISSLPQKSGTFLLALILNSAGLCSFLVKLEYRSRIFVLFPCCWKKKHMQKIYRISITNTITNLNEDNYDRRNGNCNLSNCKWGISTIMQGQCVRIPLKSPNFFFWINLQLLELLLPMQQSSFKFRSSRYLHSNTITVIQRKNKNWYFVITLSSFISNNCCFLLCGGL